MYKIRTQFYFIINLWLFSRVYPEALGINKTIPGLASFKLDIKSLGMPEGAL